MTYEKQERMYAVVRGIIGAVAIVLGMFGLTVDTEAWATVIMEIACIAITLYTWFWKNNNFTEAAINAQEYKDVVLEDGIFSEDEHGEIEDEELVEEEV